MADVKDANSSQSADYAVMVGPLKGGGDSKGSN